MYLQYKHLIRSATWSSVNSNLSAHVRVSRVSTVFRAEDLIFSRLELGVASDGYERMRDIFLLEQVYQYM